MAPDQSCFRFLPSFRRHSFKHFTVSITKIRTTVVSSTITSRQKYWIQLRSWTADRRCFAPLCRITNSVQYTESSSGSVWRSLWRADSFWMFTLYLDINWKKQQHGLDSKTCLKFWLTWATRDRATSDPTHLVSLKTSFSAWRRLSVVMETMSNTTPTPLLAIFCALSGWSPEIGTITMGTAWHSPSKRPCEPAWVMKARAPGCANTHNTKKSDGIVCDRWSEVCVRMFTDPAGRSEAPIPLSSHFLGHRLEPVQCTSILPAKNGRQLLLFDYHVDLWFEMVKYIILGPSVESVWRLPGRRKSFLQAFLTPWCPEWTLWTHALLTPRTPSPTNTHTHTHTWWAWHSFLFLILICSIDLPHLKAVR